MKTRYEGAQFRSGSIEQFFTEMFFGKLLCVHNEGRTASARCAFYVFSCDYHSAGETDQIFFHTPILPPRYLFGNRDLLESGVTGRR